MPQLQFRHIFWHCWDIKIYEPSSWNCSIQISRDNLIWLYKKFDWIGNNKEIFEYDYPNINIGMVHVTVSTLPHYPRVTNHISHTSYNTTVYIINTYITYKPSYHVSYSWSVGQWWYVHFSKTWLITHLDTVNLTWLELIKFSRVE